MIAEWSYQTLLVCCLHVKYSFKTTKSKIEKIFVVWFDGFSMCFFYETDHNIKCMPSACCFMFVYKHRRFFPPALAKRNVLFFKVRAMPHTNRLIWNETRFSISKFHEKKKTKNIRQQTKTHELTEINSLSPIIASEIFVLTL